MAVQPFDEQRDGDGESLFHQAVQSNDVLEDFDAQRMISWMADHVDSETASIAVLRGLGGLPWKATVAEMNRLYPESGPWSKSKCQARMKKITSSQAKTLRRLLGGKDQ
jgi:hypothetical protein